MNLKSVLGIALATATSLVASTSPTFSQSTSADRVTFSCKELFDSASGENIPATVAWVPQRGKNVPIIYWKSDYFSKVGWDGQARCDDVSPKFQTFYDNGRLNYLINGKNGAYPVVCAAVEEQGESCNGDNQLFQLKRQQDGALALSQLMDLLENKTSQPLYQSSGVGSSKQIAVSMEDFLMNAPAVED